MFAHWNRGHNVFGMIVWYAFEDTASNVTPQIFPNDGANFQERSNKIAIRFEAICRVLDISATAVKASPPILSIFLHILLGLVL